MPDKQKLPKASMLVKDLANVSNIVGGLGLSIAAAQKAFNSEYLDGMERLIGMAKSILGAPPAADQTAFAAVLMDFLKATAPSRYQYTETTLNVKLDLSQSMDTSKQAGLGVGYGALSLNVAMATAYSYDYRAAAECKTVINAIPADPNMLQQLLTRASALSDKALALPPASQIDDKILEQTNTIFQKLTDKTPTPTTTP